VVTRGFVDLAEAIRQKGLSQHILYAIDKVYLPRHIVSPLLENIPSLASIVVPIDSFNNQLYGILKFIIKYLRFLIVLLCYLN
jgi:hypothetical protein